MLTLEEMLLRLGLAVVLGLVIGFEREVAGKEAGLRTDMMVAAGSAIFFDSSLFLCPTLSRLHRKTFQI